MDLFYFAEKISGYMPQIEDIDQFKTLINALGHEEEILAEKGLSIEDVTPPEPDMDNELSALLDSSDADLPPDSAVTEPSSNGGMDALLDQFQKEVEQDVPDDEEPSFLFQEAATLAPAAEPDDDISAIDDFDITGNQGDIEDSEIPEDFSMDEMPEEDFSFENAADDTAADDPGEPPAEEAIDLSADVNSDFGELPEMDDFGDIPSAESLDDDDFAIPDINQKLSSLNQEAAETTPEDDDIALESEINLDQELGSDILDEISSDEGTESQHFSLDDLGIGFAMDEEKGFGDTFGSEINRLEQEIEDQEEAFEEDQLEISPSELAAIQKSLAALPLNLKISIEELLADENLDLQKMRSLLNLLIRKGSPRQVSNQLFKMTGKKIELPRGYEKSSGDEYEEMKRSFGYLFKEQTWPMLRTFLVVATLVWGLFLILFTLAYRPATAHHYYKKGYDLIRKDRYAEANKNFETAYLGWNLGPVAIRGWRTKKWFYRYAEAYQERMAFHEASQKYEDLLSIYPKDKKGRLDYADMLAFRMADFTKAESQLRVIIDGDVRNYDALLLLGDIYYKWADDDPSKLENARLAWASLLDYYGNRDEVQFRMIRYFIKTGDTENIGYLTEFYRNRKKIKADPGFQAQIFGELAGFLLDTGKPDDAFLFLQRGERADETVPEIHYQYSRYYRLVGNTPKEEKALNRTLRFLDQLTVLTPRNLLIKIDTFKRIGDLHYNLITPDGSDRDIRIAGAEDSYLKGIALFENGFDRNILKASPEIGKLYMSAGDLYYFHRMDYSAALGFYLKGGATGYQTPETDYRMGYIYYTVEKDYNKAIPLFYETTRAFPTSAPAFLALANTLELNGNYHAAQGNYNTLLDMLAREEASYPFLVPEEKEEHHRLLEMYKIVHNNLGVTLHRISGNAPGQDWDTEALYHLTRSSEYNDLLTRTPDTLERAKKEHDIPGPKVSAIYNTADMAYNNRMALLYPQKGIGLMIYGDLARDVSGRP
jgi:hypothetical protein